MKTILCILGTLLILSLPLVWLAKTSHTLKTNISVISDHTDIFIATPKVEEIKSKYNLKNSIWDEGIFRLIDVTDLNINKVQQTKLESENFLLGNKYKRIKKVDSFYSNINTIITNSLNEPIGKDNSAIYIPIVKELNQLSQSNAQTKILFIYSDLMENTNEISFYDESTFKNIKNNPEIIRRNFNSQMKLPKLTGIKIYIIYQPNNTKQDKDFKIVSDFYKSLFESKGASVEITANVN